MPSYVVSDQESMLRYVSISAQKTSTTHPTFSLYVDGVKKGEGVFERGSTGKVEEYQLFVSGNVPAVGLVFQVQASGAIVKNVNFPLERPADYSTYQLYHGARISYVGHPEYQFTIDGVALTSSPNQLIASSTPRSAVLYFPSMTMGFVPHIQRNADSGQNFVVDHQLLSLQFISQPLDQ